MNNFSRYIFRENIIQEYVLDFNNYMISVVYGDILIGDDIEAEYKDKSDEDI